MLAKIELIISRSVFFTIQDVIIFAITSDQQKVLSFLTTISVLLAKIRNTLHFFLFDCKYISNQKPIFTAYMQYDHT